MSHEQRFQARLQAQFQEAGARILRLEATLAQKDDHITQKDSQIANLNAQIQRMMNSSTSGNGKQHMTTAMQTQINQANTRVMSAENTLKQSVRNWNKYQAQWHQEKHDMWKQIQHQKQLIEDLRKENMALRSSGGNTNNADMETMVKNYKALEKQFEAHKKHDSQLKNFPASAKGKTVVETGADDDEDDEEQPNAHWLKQEPAEDHTTAQPATTSHETLSYAPPQQVAPQASMSHGLSSAPAPTAQASPALNSSRPSFTQQRAALAARAASTTSSIAGPSIVPATPPTAFAYDQYMPPTPAPSRQDSQTTHRSRANAVDLSATDSTTRAVKRRRESEQEEMKSELQGLTITDPASRANLKMKDPQARTRQGSRRSGSGPLEIINLCESPSPDPPTKRQRNSNGGYYAPAPTQPRRPTRPDIEDRMKYKAVVSQSHGRNASISYLDSVEDLADAAQDLWEQIDAVHDLWEEAKGEDWKYEFEVKLRDQDSKQCVSSKLKIEGRESGKSKWRAGCECLYACIQCVAEGKPCFVWTENEFRLLPLHEDDRVWPVEEGCENTSPPNAIAFTSDHACNIAKLQAAKLRRPPWENENAGKNRADADKGTEDYMTFGDLLAIRKGPNNATNSTDVINTTATNATNATDATDATNSAQPTATEQLQQLMEEYQITWPGADFPTPPPTVCQFQQTSLQNQLNSLFNFLLETRATVQSVNVRLAKLENKMEGMALYEGEVGTSSVNQELRLLKSAVAALRRFVIKRASNEEKEEPQENQETVAGQQKKRKRATTDAQECTG